MPELALGERKIGLDVGHKHAKNRAVGLVEEVRAAEERQKKPLVAAVPSQIGLSAPRREQEWTWQIASPSASAASFWGSSGSASSVLTIR